MQVPAGRILDAIQRVLLVHRFRVVWVNVAPHVISTHNLAISDGFDRLDGWRWNRANVKVRARRA
jgi:hypothetical protein